MIKETEGFQDILLNKYYGIRIIEYSYASNFSDWEIKGILFYEPTTLRPTMGQPQLILETFIKKIPTLKGYKIIKEVGDDRGSKIDFTAHGIDAEKLEKFLKVDWCTDWRKK